MATIEDTGGSKRLKGMFEKLRSQLPATISKIGSQMALEASMRAPSPQDEYQVMMTGEGNPDGITNVPDMGSTDDGDHRMRFEKFFDFYLQPFIATNVQMIDSMQVGVGSILQLNVASQYTWRNVTGDEYESTFPFWECWEGGLSGTFEIIPRHAGSNKAPTLKPAPGKENRRVYMTKTIPALGMYRGVDIDYFNEELLIPAIRKIVREA